MKKSNTKLRLDLTPIAMPANVQAFSTHRYSSPLTVDAHSPYSAFNLGDHVGDNLERVIQNRELLKTALPAKSQIQWLSQVHGNQVVEINEVQSQPIIADASVTRKKHIALSIMTADCLPILLADKTGTCVAAIHGGWRPLAQNIITNTLQVMAIQPKEIVAWLGPCIGKTAFEVGAEVKQAFINLLPESEQAFIPSDIPCENKDKYFADLQLLARQLLAREGVNTIEQLDDCTYSMPKRYYSYRRENITGRMASVICLVD
ncbi:peptidoglycan editing factor PgeF [Colwellia sp. MEBiC06753]